MNNFLSIIQNISLPNKYTKWYMSIIEKSFDKKITTYTEKHHIVPRSFAKDLQIENINDPLNLAKLTAKEHFICHMLLIKMFEGSLKRKMSYAIHRLSYSQNGRKSESYVSSRHYEQIRKQHSENLIGEGNPMFGRKHSNEAKQKQSNKAKQRKASPELREKFSLLRSGEGNPMFGKTHTESARQKISSARKGIGVGKDNVFYGKHHTEEFKLYISEVRKNEPRIECIHCGKITSRLNNIRWHGNNCKNYSSAVSIEENPPSLITFNTDGILLTNSSL